MSIILINYLENKTKNPKHLIAFPLHIVLKFALKKGEIEHFKKCNEGLKGDKIEL